MTDDDRLLLEGAASLLSPTLRGRMGLVRAMTRLPLCAVCPAGQWYVIEGERPHCFCTRFSGEMYDHRRQTVTACDARDDAIAALDRDPG